MPRRIKDADDRLVMSRLILAIFKTFAQGYLGETAYGSVADDAILLCAIFVGHVEGRPMNVSKLAEYAGISRTTVGRKVKAYERSGFVKLVDGKVVFAVDPLNSPRMLKVIEDIRHLILTAALELRKTDT